MQLRSAFILFLTSALGAACSENGPVTPLLDPAEFADPPAAERPWVRWWWPGNDVQPGELALELSQLATAGFGGVEIQAFDAALNPLATPEVLARRLAFDSDAYYENLRGALEAARENGLQVDLTFGTGWPAGGSRIQAEDSLQCLMLGEWTFEGPAQAEIPKLEPMQSHFYEIADFVAEAFGEQLTRFLPQHAQLVALQAARITGGYRSESMLDLSDTLELDPDSLVDLRDQVSADGGLSWPVPAGRWQVMAFFSAPSGDLPQLTAEPEEGFVLDHLDANQVLAHLEHLFGARTGLPAYNGNPLRAVFTDSFEIKVERIWARDLPAEFQSRRGYDLLPWLPASMLPGADNYIFEVGRVARAPEFLLGHNDHRLRHDYALTLSELFIERYLQTKADWLAERGLLARAQAYGLDLDVLRAAGAVQIPEAEQLYAGGSDLFLKAIAAGAHLYGRDLVSAEAMVFPLRDYMSTPTKIRAAADKAFAAGITQLVLHGFPYDHQDEYGITGWTAFSSRFGGTNTFASNFSSHTPLFDHLGPLTAYITRCQHLLRQGAPRADLAVLYPHLGFPSSLALEPGYVEALLGGFLPGEPELRQVPFAELAALFGEPVSDPRTLWLLALAPVLRDLERRGYTWEWVNPHRLAEARTRSGGWELGPMRYQALLLPELAAMDPDLAEHLAGRAGGAPILVLGDAPATQPGWLDFRVGDGRVKQAFERLLSSGRTRQVALDGDAASSALAELKTEPAMGLDQAIDDFRILQRRLENGALVTFLANLSAHEATTTLMPDGGCEDGRWFDAWTGQVHHLQGDTEAISLSLPAHNARFLVCGDGKLDGADLPPASWLKRPGPDASERMLDTWQLAVSGNDVEGGAFDQALEDLPDWRDIPALSLCSSDGHYSTTVELPSSTRIELDLGWVSGTARLLIDQEEIGTAIISPFRFDLSGKIEPGSHELTVIISPPWRNRLVGYAAAGDERYAQFTDKLDTTMQTGLMGPVRLRWE